MAVPQNALQLPALGVGPANPNPPPVGCAWFSASAFFQACITQFGALFHATAQQLALINAPGRAYIAYRTTCSAFNPQNLFSRPSYKNAALIQRNGAQHPRGLCLPCRTAQGRGGLYPFPECLQIPGSYGGCCGNCKWPDYGARCVWPDDDGDDNGDGRSGSGDSIDSDDVPLCPRRGRTGADDEGNQALIPAGQNFAVVI